MRQPGAEEEKPMAVAYPNDEGIAMFKIKAGDNVPSISMTVSGLMSKAHTKCIH